MPAVDSPHRVSPYGGSLPIFVILAFAVLWFLAYVMMRV
jgi:hypothetical protein